VGDLPVREAQDTEPGGGVLLVPLDHAGLLGGGPVVSEPVGLDDQAVVGEPEVDLVAEHPVFRQRHREAGGEGEGPEEDLQV
jgi:hypothetical protein